MLKKGILDVMATCDRACTVTAYAQLPKAKQRAASAPVTRRKVTTLPAPNKVARIRLKLSKKNKKQLKKALRKKKKVALTVRLSVCGRERRPAEGLQQEGRRQAAEEEARPASLAAAASRSPSKSPARARAR